MHPWIWSSVFNRACGQPIIKMGLLEYRKWSRWNHALNCTGVESVTGHDLPPHHQIIATRIVVLYTWRRIGLYPSCSLIIAPDIFLTWRCRTHLIQEQNLAPAIAEITLAKPPNFESQQRACCRITNFLIWVGSVWEILQKYYNEKQTRKKKEKKKDRHSMSWFRSRVLL